MRLKFAKAYRSITSLNEIEIKDFAVITGLNGAGKTHLLHAIENGSVVVEDISPSEILYYNYTDFTVVYKNQAITGRDTHQPQSRSHATKNGHSLTQRISIKRTSILEASELIAPTHYDTLINIFIDHGQAENIFNWKEDELEALDRLSKLAAHSDEYEVLYQNSFPKIQAVVNVTGGYFLMEARRLLTDPESYLSDFFTKALIKGIGFNRASLQWPDSTLSQYHDLKSKDPGFTIWSYEEMFPSGFVHVVSVLEEQSSRFGSFVNLDFTKIREKLLTLFAELEKILLKELSKDELSVLRNFGIDEDIFSPLRAESGALDLTEIASEEKQYQINKIRNDYNGYLKKKGEHVVYYSTDEFDTVYGQSPIALLNDALNKYDCNGYEFRTTNIPNQFGIDPHQHSIDISLYHKHKKYPTSLDALSSGERTLLALTFYIYKLRFKRKAVASLLLLDEIDSSLHPSMSKRLIDVLFELFFKTLNIKIIFSTHSPSTVAFAPNDSLYIMKGEGNKRLYASSKDAALKELTFGVPSFSINYENRRQIFVESKFDVEYYEKLYQIFKKSLDPDVSLNFISSGDVQKDKNGVGKSNCVQVVEITNLLRNAGNNFIWGIVDWDLKKEKPKSKYVKVLGLNERYSIENFILDPLMVSILLLYEGIRTPAYFGLRSEFKIHEVLSLKPVDLQTVIDSLLANLNSFLNIDMTEVLSYRTVGETELQLPKAFVEYQGHRLEEKYLEAFPELNRLKRNDEKALKMELLNKAIQQFPELAPSSLIEILKEVQKV